MRRTFIAPAPRHKSRAHFRAAETGTPFVARADCLRSRNPSVHASKTHLGAGAYLQPLDVELDRLSVERLGPARLNVEARAAERRPSVVPREGTAGLKRRDSHHYFLHECFGALSHVRDVPLPYLELDVHVRGCVVYSHYTL